MITKTATTFLVKFSSVDEDQLTSLMYDLRDKEFTTPRIIGKLPVHLFNDIKTIPSNVATTPNFLGPVAGKEHLFKRRMLGKDDMTSHEVTEMLRLLLTERTGSAHESWREGYPTPAISVPVPNYPKRIAFAVLNNEDPSIGNVQLRTAFYSTDSALKNRLLKPKKGKELLAARIKAKRDKHR